ncbi:MAG: serine kinase [Alphaproteobacteria bacterium]|nr:serine kinase [Alphaproteobacteria bacterium]
MGDSVHASAVQVGSLAVLIRGPSGSGKSQLAFNLVLAGRSGVIAPTFLISDDRVRLGRSGDGIEVAAVESIAGRIEIRGLGIRRCAHVGAGKLGLVVDLAAPDGARMPSAAALKVRILGVTVPRIPVMTDFPALSLVIAALTTEEA